MAAESGENCELMELLPTTAADRRYFRGHKVAAMDDCTNALFGFQSFLGQLPILPAPRQQCLAPKLVKVVQKFSVSLASPKDTAGVGKW